MINANLALLTINFKLLSMKMIFSHRVGSC